MFRDLYHDKPSSLEGTFELWQQSLLWELDGRAFLGEKTRDGGVMCRVVGKMKREVEAGEVGGMKWRLEVLSIWEAEWEDVEFVAGIYDKDQIISEG